MKRVIAVVVLVCLMLAMAGCGGKPKNMSDGVYNLGLDALSQTDLYLDAKCTADELHDILSDIYNRIGEYSTAGHDDVVAQIADSSIGSYVLILANKALHIASDQRIESLGGEAAGVTTISDLLETRNKLAESLNEKMRK